MVLVLSGSVALVEMDCMNCPIRPFLEKFSKLKANRFGWHQGTTHKLIEMLEELEILYFSSSIFFLPIINAVLIGYHLNN